MIVAVHLRFHRERRHLRGGRGSLGRRLRFAGSLALARGFLLLGPQLTFACGGFLGGTAARFFFLAFALRCCGEFGRGFGLTPQPLALGGLPDFALALFGLEAEAFLFARALGGFLRFTQEPLALGGFFRFAPGLFDLQAFELRLAGTLGRSPCFEAQPLAFSCVRRLATPPLFLEFLSLDLAGTLGGEPRFFYQPLAFGRLFGFTAEPLLLQPLTLGLVRALCGFLGLAKQAFAFSRLLRFEAALRFFEPQPLLFARTFRGLGRFACRTFRGGGLLDLTAPPSLVLSLLFGFGRAAFGFFGFAAKASLFCLGLSSQPCLFLFGGAPDPLTLGFGGETLLLGHPAEAFLFLLELPSSALALGLALCAFALFGVPREPRLFFFRLPAHPVAFGFERRLLLLRFARETGFFFLRFAQDPLALRFERRLLFGLANDPGLFLFELAAQSFGLEGTLLFRLAPQPLFFALLLRTRNGLRPLGLTHVVHEVRELRLIERWRIGLDDGLCRGFLPCLGMLVRRPVRPRIRGSTARLFDGRLRGVLFPGGAGARKFRLDPFIAGPVTLFGSWRRPGGRVLRLDPHLCGTREITANLLRVDGWIAAGNRRRLLLALEAAEQTAARRGLVLRRRREHRQGVRLDVVGPFERAKVRDQFLFVARREQRGKKNDVRDAGRERRHRRIPGIDDRDLGPDLLLDERLQHVGLSRIRFDREDEGGACRCHCVTSSP